MSTERVTAVLDVDTSDGFIVPDGDGAAYVAQWVSRSRALTLIAIRKEGTK